MNMVNEYPKEIGLFETCDFDLKINSRKFSKPLHNLSKVFLDITIPEKSINLGRLVIELRSDIVPRTCKNFKNLCCCDKPDRCYRGTRFHRIIPDCYYQGGDIEFNNGGGFSVSSFDGGFQDESFLLRHSRPGIISTALSMVPDRNAAQFIITTAPVPWLDGYCVPFGELVEGFNVLEKMKCYGSQSGKTRTDVVITNSGEIVSS